MTEPSDEDFFTLVCTDMNPYAIWQVEFLEHTWLRANMPGELVWLVASPDGNDVPTRQHARVVRTSAPNTHPRIDGDYMPINRLYSIQEWLEREQPVGTVMFIDCDMVFRERVRHVAAPRGRPIGQRWWDFSTADPRWSDAIATLDPAIADRVQPVTWPMVIHTSDLQPLMERWLELTGDFFVRSRAWESDMMALAFTLAERDLQCDLEMLSAWTPWPEEVVAGAPILHACQPVLRDDGDVMWFKQTYSPWDEVAEPNRAELDYCRDLLRMLNRYAALRRKAASYRRD